MYNMHTALRVFKAFHSLEEKVCLIIPEEIHWRKISQYQEKVSVG